MTGSLDSLGNGALVLGTVASLASRADPSIFHDEAPQEIYVFVVDLQIII